MSLRDAAAHASAAVVLTTAVEGGVNYWAVCSNIVRDPDSRDVTSVTLTDEEDGGIPHKVTSDSVFEALRKLAGPAYFDALGLSEQAEVRRTSPTGSVWPRQSLERKCALLVLNGEDELDAGDADDVVQVAIFGGVVYG